MRKAKQIGPWLAVGAIVLALQGCWGDEQDQLTLLGDGGCRTADGGDGEPQYVSGLSLDACKARCGDGGDTACTAIEYNTGNGICEVHSKPITIFNAVDGVACYVRG